MWIFIFSSPALILAALIECIYHALCLLLTHDIYVILAVISTKTTLKAVISIKKFYPIPLAVPVSALWSQNDQHGICYFEDLHKIWPFHSRNIPHKSRMELASTSNQAIWDGDGLTSLKLSHLLKQILSLCIFQGCT